MWVSWCSYYLELSGLLDLDVCYFSRLGNFSAIIYSHVLLPLSLSLFSFWVPIMQMLVHLLLFHKFLRLSSLFFFFLFFSFCCSDWMSSIDLSWVQWSFLPLDLVCHWSPLLYLFSSGILSSMISVWCFLIFYFCWNSYSSLSILLLSSVRCLMNIILNFIR